ncbi:MAG TPA: RagB/SusD family nutrient uptake outer membrane protein, partial [Rikenellaceae bacterium]|nr:RagB/SusD family nutrient uptake outer membrane protein [Rikenellaceae bacterium]
TALGALTSDETGSLLEEILIQRRIELWGEYGRIYDIRRLKQGFTRTAAMGWPTAALITGRNTQNPNSYAWVLTIPQAEFDGNKNLDQTVDQNPMDDGV